MLKIGIIGCGKIADQHASHIKYIKGCNIVGVADSEELMARQMADRWSIPNWYDDVKSLVERAKPHVIHITTPPHSHFSLGMECIEAGCHVYIEKPFTMDYLEAHELIDAAIKNNVKLTVGHNVQFTHVANRMRKLIKNGFLGGQPVHMESIFCYNLQDPAYAKSLLGDKNHWVRSLPGNLLQNIISHGIAKIVEYLPGDNANVTALGFSSDVLKGINETDIKDELRVIIKGEKNPITSTFTFSSQMSPVLHQLRIYGPNNSLIVDDDHQTMILMRGSSHKSYLNQFVPPAIFAKQYLKNSLHNIYSFLKQDFYNDSGMRNLIERFYTAIQTESEELPITYREILLTTRIMDKIFNQIKLNKL